MSRPVVVHSRIHEACELAGAPGPTSRPAAASSAPDATRTLERLQNSTRALTAIIGSDNRQQVEDMGYPHTAIGQLRYVEARSGSNFLCTGTLFSERHVLTNAHCIYDKDERRYHSRWQFAPGLKGSNEPFGRVQ